MSPGLLMCARYGFAGIGVSTGRALVWLPRPRHDARHSWLWRARMDSSGPMPAGYDGRMAYIAAMARGAR